MQTARIDYNVNERNTTWFRFQADTGLQAAYTDPINPLFNAASPQPLYSFATGYTHVFSQNLVNYFNPAFSWYESLFGPNDLSKTLAAWPIVLQGSPFTTIGGLDNTWVQGRRASRFFLNDNLAWTLGAHELRFGTNIRIFRLNDYDFGEGVVPTVSLRDSAAVYLRHCVDRVGDFSAGGFAAVQLSQPGCLRAGYLESNENVDLDLRSPRDAQFESGESARCGGAAARIVGRNFAQRQSAARCVDRNKPGEYFRVDAAGDSATPNRARLAGHVEDSAANRVRSIQRHSAGERGGSGRRQSAVFQDISRRAAGHGRRNRISTARSPRPSRPTRRSPPGSRKGSYRARRPYRIRRHACSRWRSRRFRTASFTRHTSCNGASRWSSRSAPPMNLRAQYVGTRAVNQPYETQVNGYQTVCQGCFAPFPYGQPSDPRFGAVTQLSTGANSHYNGLQLTADKRLTHGLQVLANYTWSHCMDTVSNGGFLPFSAGGILTPLPGELGRQYGPCDYDVRDNFTAQYVYQLPFKVRSKALGAAVNGWQVSGTAFWHSGVPFSVLSTPYSANGDGIVQGSGPQFASVVAGVPVYAHQPIAGVTPAGTVQWLNPNAFVSAVDPSTGACAGGDNPQNCQFGNLGRNALRGPDFAWGDFYLTKWFSLHEHVKLRVDAQAFNLFNHPNFALPAVVYAGIPGRPSTQTGFGALTYTTAPPTGLLGVGLGGDSSPRMIAFQARLEF